MKFSSKVLLAIFIGTGLNLNSFAQDFKALSGVQFDFPSNGDWDSGFGLKVTPRNIQPNKWGYGFSIGVGKLDRKSVSNSGAGVPGVRAAALFDANNQVRAKNAEKGITDLANVGMLSEGVFVTPFITDATITRYKVSGDLNMFPIGPSAFYRVTEKNGLSIVCEAGLRYVVLDSRVDVEIDYSTGRGDVPGRTYKERVDVSDAITAVVGVEILKNINENLSAFLGIGYQVDLDKGSVRGTAGTVLDDFEIGGVQVSGGIGVKF